MRLVFRVIRKFRLRKPPKHGLLRELDLIGKAFGVNRLLKDLFLST